MCASHKRIPKAGAEKSGTASGNTAAGDDQSKENDCAADAGVVGVGVGACVCAGACAVVELSVVTVDRGISLHTTVISTKRQSKQYQQTTETTVPRSSIANDVVYRGKTESNNSRCGM